MVRLKVIMFLVSGCGLTVNGNDAAERLFNTIELSQSGYGTNRTNGTTFPQSSVIMDNVVRAGYYWRYAFWFDRTPPTTPPKSRMGLASQRCPSSKDPTNPNNWEAPTITFAPTGLNPDDAATDAHNSISGEIDAQGRLNLVWNAHWDEWQGALWRGTGPGDITLNTSNVMGGSTGNALPTGFPTDWSYGKWIKKQDGLCFTARQGASGTGYQGLWEQTDEATNTWNSVGHLIDFASGSPYMQHVYVNPVTDKIHFGFTVAEGQNTTTYRDSYYFLAERTGGVWTFRPDIGSSSVSLPITDASTFRAWQTGLNRGVQVHGGLTSTTDDKPLLMLQCAKDGVPQGGGSNRYLLTKDAGVWSRTLIGELSPTWNLVDANGSTEDPFAPDSEYAQVSAGQLLYTQDGKLYCTYRTNYFDGSGGMPVFMITGSSSYPFSSWTPERVWIDLPVGDSGPCFDSTAWNTYNHYACLGTLLDTAGQYPGGAASFVYLVDAEVPEI
jgi:hypothetical protein